MDGMSRRERSWKRAASAVARLLVVLYPPAFRREAGAELARDFGERAADRARVGGSAAAALWLVRAVGSLLANAVGAWRDGGRHPATPYLAAAGPARLPGVAGGGAERSVPRGGAEPLLSLAQEVRTSARALLRAPGFAAVVVGTLALGIGGTTAVFTVVRAVLLRPLPYERPEQLVRLYQFDVEEPEVRQYVSAPHFLEYRERASAFQDLAALYTYDETGADLLVGDQPERVRVLRVSADYFRLLGQPPSVGRGFTGADEAGERVAVVSEALHRRLGVPLGASLDLDGEGWVLVGVAPAALEDPVVGRVDVWTPLDLHSGGARFPGNHYLSVLGRLDEGVTPVRAREEMAALDRVLAETWPDAADGAGFRLVPLQDDLVREARPTLLVLLGAVGLVLLIACVNVANLQMIRAVGRRREVAVRSALGGGRGLLIRRLLTESLLLALVGGTAGVGVAVLGVDGLRALGGSAIPRAQVLEVDATVLAFTAAVALLTGLAFGSLPPFACRGRHPRTPFASRARGRRAAPAPPG